MSIYEQRRQAEKRMAYMQERITELEQSLKATLTKCATVERKALDRAEQAEARITELGGQLKTAEYHFDRRNKEAEQAEAENKRLKEIINVQGERGLYKLQKALQGESHD